MMQRVSGFIGSRSRPKISLVMSPEHNKAYYVMDGVTRVGIVHLEEKTVQLLNEQKDLKAVSAILKSIGEDPEEYELQPLEPRKRLVDTRFGSITDRMHRNK